MRKIVGFSLLSLLSALAFSLSILTSTGKLYDRIGILSTLVLTILFVTILVGLIIEYTEKR